MNRMRKLAILPGSVFYPQWDYRSTPWYLYCQDFSAFTIHMDKLFIETTGDQQVS